MVRFKVVHASRLLLAAAVVVLLAVVAALALRWFSAPRAPAWEASASLVETQNEAKTTAVFASSGAPGGLPLDPGPGAIEIEVVEEAPSPAPQAAAPSVLIYHTHTHEAYEQVQEDPYEALEAWRTTDADHSVVRVGEELALQLRALGFDVVHDTTEHEGSALSTAYTRSLATLESYENAFDLYIDLHRDAYVQGAPRSHITPAGESLAQVMMLIGNGNGFDVKPYYAQNLAFARALADRVNAQEAGLCKPVLVKDGRYNQNIGVFSILIEVGHNRNTLEEALDAVPPLARALHSLMVAAPDPELERMRRQFRASQAPVSPKTDTTR